jgi:hypothetical protein
MDGLRHIVLRSVDEIHQTSSLKSRQKKIHYRASMHFVRWRPNYQTWHRRDRSAPRMLGTAMSECFSRKGGSVNSHGPAGCTLEGKSYD